MVSVLVSSPVYEGMRYAQEAFLACIHSLTYDSYDILLIDNTPHAAYYESLKSIEGITVLHDTSLETDKKMRLISSRNKILAYATKKGYDYVLMLDFDVLPPRDVIERLLAHQKKIVSGLYFNFWNAQGKLKLLPVCWKALTPKEFDEIRTQVSFPEHVIRTADVRRHITRAEVESGELLEVVLPSAGCMLIHRDVFTQITYSRFPIPHAQKATSDDVYFIRSALKKGFTAYCDPTILCYHLLFGKYKKNAQGNLVSEFTPEYEHVNQGIRREEITSRLVQNEFVSFLNFIA